MVHDIVVTLDHWSVYSLSRYVHTIDQVELDSQHAPSSSSRLASSCVVRSCEVGASACVMRSCGVAESARYA